MKYYFPGQKKEIFWTRVRAFLYGFCIAAFIFTGLGYAWRMIQTDQEYQDKIANITNKYINARNRVADLEARLGIKQGKNKRR